MIYFWSKYGPDFYTGGMQTPDITVIVGPTASGKTRRSLDLAKAQGAEIISADAFQIYTGLDIGSAKLPMDEREGIPHHLIDIKAIDTGYSVAEFLRLSAELISKLRAAGTPILICGGTALYTQAFLYNYQFPSPDSPQQGLRDELNQRADEDGLEALWADLKEKDADMAQRIHPNDRLRIIRALEIHAQQDESPSHYYRRDEQIRADTRVELLMPDRELLYERINQRVDEMMADGWIDEVRTLRTQYAADAAGFRAIGYIDIMQYLDGELAYDKMVDMIKQKTRRFAKRQYTWYRQLSEHATVITP